MAAQENWQRRAPTPREQELEAQNKALWELLEDCEVSIHLLAGYTELRQSQPLKTSAYIFAKSTLTAIQKEKEGKI